MRQSLILSALSGLRLFLLTLTQVFIFARLGAGAQTDALVASGALPQLMVALLSNALVQVMVPLFSSAARNETRQDAWTLMSLVVVSYAAIGTILIVTADYWVTWLIPGFAPATKLLAVSLTRIQLVGMMFSLPFAIAWSLHCARGRLIWGEGAPLISAAVALGLMVFLLPQFGAHAAASILALRSALDFLLLAYILGKWMKPNFNAPMLRRAWLRARYLLFGALYYGTEPLVNQLLASFAPAGSLTMLSLGQQLYGVSSQIINKGFAAPVMPRLSVAAHEQKWDDFRKTLRERLAVVASLALLAFAFVAGVGHPLLQVFAGRVAFSSADLNLLWQVLVALGGVLVAGWIGVLTTTALHAAGDTRRPMWLSVATYTLYTPIKFLAFSQFGLLGLAVTSSLYYLVNLAGQLVFIQRMLNGRHNPKSAPAVITSNIASS